MRDKYEAAVYTVHAPRGSFDMKVDEYSDGVAALALETRSECALFITACNPMGEKLSDKENAVLFRKLLREVSPIFGRSLVYQGVGQSADGTWKEPSVLVMHQEYPDWGYKLARKYKQIAFLWIPENRMPSLVMTDDAEREARLTTHAYKVARGYRGPVIIPPPRSAKSNLA